ncbi:hypothetical protein [Treponema sp.]|uniref:hypothetical protein n=1 Tax=Treponema sp. TaxID=166 RepID=UPI00388FC75D
MKRNILKLSAAILTATITFFSCDNFLNSNLEYKEALEEEIRYAKAASENVVIGYNNDDYGTVGSGVLNYSISAKVGYAFNASFNLKATSGNFVGWKAYTLYDPDVPENCVELDSSYVEFMNNSQTMTTATVKLLKEVGKQIRLIPEVSAFPVMEVCLPAALSGLTPSPASFNPPQTVKAVTPGQEYSITATSTVDYGFPENAEDCWKVYRKNGLGNETEIINGDKITITKNTGTQLANGRSQSTIYITVDNDFSGRFYVSPNLVTYPRMNVEVAPEYADLVKMSHSGIVSMAKGTPYTLTLQTDPSVGLSGWRLFKRNNSSPYSETECFAADSRTTTDTRNFTTYSDSYIEVKNPSYEVAETGKTAGKVNSSIIVTLKDDMDHLSYSYFLEPVFFKYPVVNIKDPDGYSSAGRFSLTGAGYLDNDTVRMMMNSYEYTITYRTTEDYSFSDTKWLVYETSAPGINLADAADESRIDIARSSVMTDDSGASTCSVSVTLKHNFGTALNIKPVVVQKPSMNIAFADGTPSGVTLSAGGNSITSGTDSNRTVKMAASKIYTATVNVPAGLSFEGWRLEKVNASNSRSSWITESTKSTTDAIDGSILSFDASAASDNPASYISISNPKYNFEAEGRNAGTTKATVDISFKKELNGFSLHLIPVIKVVPSVNFVLNGTDCGTLSPSDERNLYLGTKIDLTYKSTKNATAGNEIWKVKILNEAGGYDDYSGNVGYTENDLTSALNSALNTKNIIIYNNDREAEVQPNIQGEYITTKTATLYVNKVPPKNLQISVTPEIYNTIKFSTGSAFEATSYDTAVYIPKDRFFNFELKTKEGYKFNSIGTPANGANTSITVTSQTTASNGVTTVKGTIKSTKNHGDAVIVTPTATELTKVNFSVPVLSGSANYATEEEDAGTTSPSSAEFLYQVANNSIGIKLETTYGFTYEGFAADSTKFTDISSSENSTDSYVLTTGTLSQAKAKAANAKIVIHDVREENIADGQGQIKKRVTGTLTVLIPDTTVTVKPLVKGKPGFQMSIAAADQGSISPSIKKSIFIGEDYDISYLSSSGYGFDKWTVSNNGSVIPVLTLSDAAGSAGTSAAEFVVDLETTQELTGTKSLTSIKTALASNSSKLLAVIYRTSKVESQATEGVETVTAKFRIVKDINSEIIVSPVTYQHSYFYVADDTNATSVPSSTSKAMVKKGRDYDFRIVTNTNYMYSTLSFSGATVANAGSTINPTFSNYTTQDAVCYNLLPSVNKETGVVTVTGKLRMLKEPEKTIILNPKITTFPRITLAEETSGDTTRLTLGNNTVSGGSVTASIISDYEKSGTTYVTKYIDYDIEAVPSDSKGAYKYSSQSMFKVYNSTGTRLTTGLQITESTTCPAFNSNSNLIIYDCHLVSMENGNYKAVAKIRVKSGTYTIKPGIYTQPKIAIQSINAGDITSITFNGQRTSSDSISAQTLYTNGGQPRNYEFSIKLKEGFAVYTENAESPEDSNPNTAVVSLKAYSPANEELSCGYNGDYNLYNKNGDADEETLTIIHEIEQNFDGTNYVLTGKIRSFEGANIVLKPNVYKIPVINFEQPYYEEDDTTPGTLKINNITQAQAYSSPSLLSTKLNFIYTASTGYYLKEFKVYDSAGTLKSTYSVGPSSITAGTSVAGLSFSNLTVASASRQKISGTLTVTAPSVDGYKIVPVYVKGSLGPTLESCGLSYYPVKYTNTQNGSYYDLTNTTAIKTVTISANTTLSPATNQNYYIDSKALAAGGTQIASNEAKYTSTSLKNVFTGETGSNSFSVTLEASNANFPGNEDYVPVKVKVTEKLVGLYANMYYMTENDEKSTVRITSARAFDSDLYPEVYSCAGNLIETCKTITTAANFTSSKQTGKTTTVTFTFGLNFNIPFGGIHQFEISAIDSKGNETEKRTICLEYPRPEFKDSEQGANLKKPAALRKAGGTTVYVRYITDNDPTSTDYPYLVYYSSSTSRCHFRKPYFSTNGYDETVSILKRSTAFQSAYIRLANRYGFLTPSRKTLSGLTTSIAGPGDIVYRKLNSTKKYVCALDDYLENPSIGEPIALIVSGTGYATNSATPAASECTQILGMGLKVPTQDYYYPGKLKFFNDVTETLGTGDKAKSYQVIDLIKTTSQTICGTTDGMGKDNLETYQTSAFKPMQNWAGINVPYAITGSNARASSSQSFPTFSYAAHYSAIELNGFTGEIWYIPTVKEFNFVQNELSLINNALNALNVTPLDVAGIYWTSTIDNKATDFYTYQLNLISHFAGTAGTSASHDITTYSIANYVRVFYDFTGELETE